MQNSYLLEFLTLDEFRYENAVTLGADRMFLPQYRQANKIRSRELAAHNIGLAYAHNNMLYPSFINGDVINSCQERLFGFGLENAAFFPYWKPNPDGISVDGSGVVVSYWKNPAGMLFTVLNSTNEPRQAALKLPEKYSSATLYEPVADTEREFVAGSTFELAPYQMALVQLKF